jgi:hypothetical protein
MDYGAFEPGYALPSQSFMIAEQIPGRVAVTDVTRFLNLGLFPSYNIPFDEQIYAESGYVDMVR